jgi:hypothetical protein
MSDVILEGTTVRIATSSPLTSLGGTIVTPDKWHVSVRSPDAIVSVYEWTNPTGDPTGNVVVPSTGNVYIDLDTTLNSGVWKVVFTAEPVTGGSDSTHTKCVKDFIFHVQPLPFEDIE